MIIKMYSYEKKLIGYLVKVYREEKYKTDNHFSRQSFISFKSNDVLKICSECEKKCKTKDRICSYKTLINVENGSIAKNDCFYIDFLSKLGFSFALNSELIKALNECEEKTQIALNLNEKEVLMNTIQEVEYHLKRNAKIGYFSEMLMLYDSILQVQLAKVFPNIEFINLIENIYPHLRTSTKILAATLLYRYYSLSNSNKSKSTYYIREVHSLDPNNIEFLILYHQLERPFMDYYFFLNKYCVNDLNSYQKFTVLQRKAQNNLELNLLEEALSNLNECYTIATSMGHELPDKERYQTRTRMGIIHYLLNQYEQAIDCFKEVLTFDINLLLMNIILLFNCLEKTKRIDEIPAYLSLELSNQITLNKVRICFNYYKNKYSGLYSEKELEDYIITDLKPILPKGIMYHEIIVKDLMGYCEKTKDYKANVVN